MPKGWTVYVEQMKKFVEWLEHAESGITDTQSATQNNITINNNNNILDGEDNESSSGEDNDENDNSNDDDDDDNNDDNDKAGQ